MYCLALSSVFKYETQPKTSVSLENQEKETSTNVSTKCGGAGCLGDVFLEIGPVSESVAGIVHSVSSNIHKKKKNNEAFV